MDLRCKNVLLYNYHSLNRSFITRNVTIGFTFQMHDRYFISLNIFLNAYNTSIEITYLRNENAISLPLVSIQMIIKIPASRPIPFQFPILSLHTISILTIHLSLQHDEMSNYDKMGEEDIFRTKTKRDALSPLSIGGDTLSQSLNALLPFYLSCKRIISRLNLRHPR